MKVEVRASNVPVSEGLQAHIMRCLDFALRRFAARVDHVVVRLVDLNGPKGGPDKRCRITARLLGPTILAEAIDADAYVAISQACMRIEDRVTRALSRKRVWALPKEPA
jgi:putative sigma-54 modulation protein